MHKHKFDAKNKNKLDNENRRKMLPPYETLEKLELKEGEIVADIGCGIGYFSIPAAEIVGEVGKVFAIDISSEMLEEVNKKIKEKNKSNIESVKIDGSNFTLSDESIDYAFMCTVLHEIDQEDEFLNETKRIMKNEGKVVIVEWEKVETQSGPPKDHRLDKKYVKQQLTENGFKNVRHIDLSDNFYAVIGQK